MSGDLLQCPICLERFCEPQVLPGCGHTFCRGCVRQLCDTAAARGAQPSCPTCRQAFAPDEVRANFVLQDLLAEASEAQGAGSSSAPPPQHPGGGLVRRSPQLRSAIPPGLGLPPRLAQLVMHEDRQIGLRIYLLDNSGSTSAHDGKIVRQDAAGRVSVTSCTRWEEIKFMAMEQADWNCRMGTPCEFMLLNPGPPPLREGIDFVRLDVARGNLEMQTSRLSRMLDASGPRGATPLADRVREIYSRVATEHAGLAGAGQRVILVVATDGLPTSTNSSRSTDRDRSDLVESLRHLMITLPVSVVIRLCTDEEVAVEFYNQVEGELELPLDVLDDLEGEAAEIKERGNGWFAYSPALHRLREGGTFTKLLDLLDERRLTPVEAALLAQLLLRADGAPPLPQDPVAFCNAAAELLEDAALVYDPLSGKMVPPVDIHGLRVALMGGMGMLAPLRAFLCNCVSSGNYSDVEEYSSDDD